MLGRTESQCFYPNVSIQFTHANGHVLWYPPVVLQRLPRSAWLKTQRKCAEAKGCCKEDLWKGESEGNRGVLKTLVGRQLKLWETRRQVEEVNKWRRLGDIWETRCACSSGYSGYSGYRPLLLMLLEIETQSSSAGKKVAEKWET